MNDGSGGKKAPPRMRGHARPWRKIRIHESDPDTMSSQVQQPFAEDWTRRFDFGRNWSGFLRQLSDARIASAEDSLGDMLSLDTLDGKTFLDIGSGSGIFSLAARRLGASVRSFDYDPDSVVCTRELKARYFAKDPEWTVEEGSALDADYVASLGKFDVVYSWGVLHHTGALWAAMEIALNSVAPRGQIFIAIYNDQGWVSGYWRAVKRLYNRGPVHKLAVTAAHMPYLLGARWAFRKLTDRPLERGMSLWYDMHDWLGGYPFEVAKPEEIVHLCSRRGFELQSLRTCGGRMGCNEFVFQRKGVMASGAGEVVLAADDEARR